MKSTDWTKAEKLAAKMAPRMQALMERIARRFGETAWEDDMDRVAGFGFDIARRGAQVGDDSNSLGVTFEIWDSGDADDGIYGEHGNFVLDITEWGGRIVGGITPENYTDDVWVDYEGQDEEWERRLAGIEAAEDDIADMIQEWIDEEAS